MSSTLLPGDVDRFESDDYSSYLTTQRMLINEHSSMKSILGLGGIFFLILSIIATVYFIVLLFDTETLPTNTTGYIIGIVISVIALLISIMMIYKAWTSSDYSKYCMA